jgi:hypothetical protein
MKTDAEVLLMMRKRAKGTTQDQAAARAGMCDGPRVAGADPGGTSQRARPGKYSTLRGIDLSGLLLHRPTANFLPGVYKAYMRV